MSGSATDLALHPTNPQIVYAAFPDGLWRSTNGGSFNRRVTTTNCTNGKVAVTPAAPSSVYFYYGNNAGSFLQISQDTGTNWQPPIQPQMSGGIPVDSGQFNYNNYLAVAPNNANVIYIGNRDLFRSTNGGTSWTNMTNIWFWDTTNTPPSWDYSPTNARTHSDQQTLTFAAADGTLAYIGNDGGITKVTNPAATPVFESLNQNLSLTQFVGYTMHPTDAARSCGGSQDNGTQRRLNTSDAWKEFDGGDGGMPVLNPTNPSHVFANYPMGSIGRYTQHGTSQEAVIANGGSNGTNWNGVQNERVAFYAPLVNNGSDSTLYFGTIRVWTTDANNPTQCTALGNPPTDLTSGGTDVLSAIGVQRSNYSATQTIYTGSALGRVMVSQDGGQTWTNRTSGLPNRFVKSITVAAGDANTAYVTFSGFSAGDGTGHVYRTTDAGASWTDISGVAGSGGLSDIPVNSLFIDPNDANKIYVGTDIGVFRTTVGGTTWENFNNGIPPAIVNAIVSTNNGGTIQAATYGRGAYQLSNESLLQVTYPNTSLVSWSEGSQQTVTWNVGGNAGTNVNVLLSADGGQTYPFTLASNTQNDGAQVIIVPDVGPAGTTQARVKVEAVGNAFFDTSDENFTMAHFPVYTVSGRITMPSGGLENINVQLDRGGFEPRTTRTDANGDYIFNFVPADANYSITPSSQQHIFGPASHTTGVLTGNVTRDFIARTSRIYTWTQLTQVIAIQEGNPQNIQRNNHWNNFHNWEPLGIPGPNDRIIVSDSPRTYYPPGGLDPIIYTPQWLSLNGVAYTINNFRQDGNSITGGILTLGGDIPGSSQMKRGLLDLVLNINAGATFDWNGGIFHSAATVAQNGFFLVTGSGERTIGRDGVVINNAGEMLWSGSPTITML